MVVKDLLPTAIKDIELSKDRVKDWEPLFDGEEPTMTHVVGVSQAILDEGLDILIERLETVKPGQTIDRKTGQLVTIIVIELSHVEFHVIPKINFNSVIGGGITSFDW